MLIFIAILFIVYGIIIYFKEENYFPTIFKLDGGYKKVAKSVMILGAFLLFLGIFLKFNSIDIFGIIMIVIILILIGTKIIYSIIV